jgi:thiol-disulfide isomerase/thioredoxin
MGNIMAIKVNGRTASAPHVQEVLTKYGCNIKTRVGFHEVNEDQCSMDGILILQLFGEDKEIQEMLGEMGKIDGVTAKIITL